MNTIHCLIVSTLFVLASMQREGRRAPGARLRRSNDLGGESGEPTLSDDLRTAQLAVKSELRRESELGTLGSGEYLANALEAENSDAPWWKRLMSHFQNGLGKTIKDSLRKAFDEHFAPAIRKGVDHHILPQLRNQLER